MPSHTKVRLRSATARKWLPHVDVAVPSAAGVTDVFFVPGTGTHVVVLDRAVAGHRSRREPSCRWSTWCNEHDCVEHWSSLDEARRQAGMPESWCERCIEIDAAYDDLDDDVELGPACEDEEHVNNNGFLWHRACGAAGCPGIDG
jgi:hypothetical protein